MPAHVASVETFLVPVEAGALAVDVAFKIVLAILSETNVVIYFREYSLKLLCQHRQQSGTSWLLGHQDIHQQLQPYIQDW